MIIRKKLPYLLVLAGILAIIVYLNKPDAYSVAVSGNWEAVLNENTDGLKNIKSKLRMDSLLMLSAKQNNYQISSLLLKEGLDVNYCNVFKRNALWMALAYSDANMLKLLDQYKVDVKLPDGDTPLIIASRFGNANALAYILKNNKYDSDPNQRNRKGWAALHEVLKYWDFEHNDDRIFIVKALILEGANPALMNNEWKPSDDIRDSSFGVRPENPPKQTGFGKTPREIIESNAQLMNIIKDNGIGDVF